MFSCLIFSFSFFFWKTTWKNTQTCHCKNVFNYPAWFQRGKQWFYLHGNFSLAFNGLQTKKGKMIGSSYLYRFRILCLLRRKQSHRFSGRSQMKVLIPRIFRVNQMVKFMPSLVLNLIYVSRVVFIICMAI